MDDRGRRVAAGVMKLLKESSLIAAVLVDGSSKYDSS